jgi:nucleoside-diphosphate-sugar epimerase
MSVVVVTGARGYIGTALAKALAAQGHGLRPTSRSRDAGPDGLPFRQSDLAREEEWLDLLQDADAVVHLSSRTDLRAAESDPSGDEALNVLPVRAMLKAAAKACNCPRVIYASAVTIVGLQHANPVDELTPDHPVSVYDRHKLACEQLLAKATSDGIVRACSLRLANVYGPGHSTNANRGILNVMMRRALTGEALTLYGKGEYIRDFVHLDDVVAAFAAELAADVCDGRLYVIASGVGHTLADAYRIVAEEAFRAIGREATIREVPGPADLHPIERRSFVGDSSLYRRLTGWRPRIALRDGVALFFAAQMAHAESGR